MTAYLPARGTDPVTSWQAAEHVTSSGKACDQRHIAVATVRKHPGLTSFELASHCSLDRFQLARRLPECRLLSKGAPRQCSVTGRQAVTWWPAHAEQVAA